jgi:hypothetical protein
LRNGAAIFTNDGSAARRLQNEVQAGTSGINVHISVPMAYAITGRPNDGSPWVADGSNVDPGRPVLHASPRLVFFRALLFGMALANLPQPRTAGPFPSPRTCMKIGVPTACRPTDTHAGGNAVADTQAGGKGRKGLPLSVAQRM